MNYTFVRIGAICAFLSVAIGAFGAHMVQDTITPERFANYQTAVQYQMMHSLGLIAVGFLGSQAVGQAHLRRAGWSMLIGIIVFSGSLYTLSLTDIRMLGAITPIGGVAFLFGWLSLVLALRK